jgi:hypothetical protein
MSETPHPELSARLMAEIRLTPDANFDQVFAALMGCAGHVLAELIRCRGTAALPDARRLADSMTPLMHEVLDEVLREAPPPAPRNAPNWNGA